MLPKKPSSTASNVPGTLVAGSSDHITTVYTHTSRAPDMHIWQTGREEGGHTTCRHEMSCCVLECS